MKKSGPKASGISVNTSTEGDSLINEIEKMVNNKEPIKTTKPLIYTERSEGVLMAFNIRADRFDIAIDAMDKIGKSYEARRQGKIKETTVNDVEVVENQSISDT